MTAHQLRTCVRNLFVIVGLLFTPAWCQKINSFDREYAEAMLQQIASDVKKHYYDPKLHGLDWDSKVREMKQRIDQADTTDGALSQVAALLDLLKDSHTYFFPPKHAYRHDYGWKAQLIGGRCYVIRVRPGSDAESKGVKPGDEVLSINGYAPTRSNFWKIDYVFETLRPQPVLHLDLQDPAGKQHGADALTKIIETNRARDLGADLVNTGRAEAVLEMQRKSHEARARIVEVGEELMIAKFPFFFFNELEVDSLIGKARKHKALILDLRGNEGGSTDTLKYLLGAIFDREVKIGELVGRDERRPIAARTHGHCFDGKIVVLVDSSSTSAAEFFARIVQIEKRGVVLGDLSSGRVMEAKFYTYKTGAGVVVFYGASITDADIIMTDGKSLEHVGVTPDEVVLPSAADLANSRDPVLAHAAETVGVKLSPEAAGKMFPYEWPPL